MIVRITFIDKKTNEPYQMLFGTSYKQWYDQVIEYLGIFFCSRERGWTLDQMLGNIKKVEVSKAKWKGWGGLKWCSHENFQHELNREGVQQKDPDNPNPRKYDDMHFYEEDIDFVEKYIRKEFEY